MRQTNIKTLIEALYILSRDIQSEDGVANACIAEGAQTLDKFREQLDGAYNRLGKYRHIKRMFTDKEEFCSWTESDLCEIMDGTEWEVEDYKDVLRIVNDIMPLIYKRLEKLAGGV